MTDHVVDPERIMRVAQRLAVAERDPEGELCAAAAAVIGVSGAGLVLMTDGGPVGSVSVSDPITAVLEEVEYTLGEGPCIEAFRTRAPVLVPDLMHPGMTRWPEFRAGALAAGARAAFGFPLMVGESCIGALNLNDSDAGNLTDVQLADAAAVAHVAARTIFGWQASAPPGAVAWQLEQVPAHRAAVHQATGIVSVQSDVSLEDALLLLRAYAFAQDRALSAVVDDVVAGRLRLD